MSPATRRCLIPPFSALVNEEDPSLGGASCSCSRSRFSGAFSMRGVLELFSSETHGAGVWVCIMAHQSKVMSHKSRDFRKIWPVATSTRPQLLFMRRLNHPINSVFQAPKYIECLDVEENEVGLIGCMETSALFEFDAQP